VTKADKWTALENWLEDAKVAFQIQDWEIVVLRDAAEIDAHADIDVSTQRNSAQLRVQRDFFDLTPEKQRLVLCHELGHIITSRADNVVESLEHVLGKMSWSTFDPNYVDASERMVEHYARIIAPTMPLPKLPKK